jgi:Leucine-rich repeat (LRR) protein
VVPAGISQLASLASLRLSGNMLQDDGLPWAALAQLRGLTLLAMDCNALSRLPAALGACSGLVRLSVSGNRIAEVEEGALGGLVALRELDLSENELAALPETTGELAHVLAETLVATCCGARSLVDSLRERPASTCRSHQPPALSILGCCTALQDLNACGNRLTAMPHAVTSLERLQSLRLDNNRCPPACHALHTFCCARFVWWYNSTCQCALQ